MTLFPFDLFPFQSKKGCPIPVKWSFFKKRKGSRPRQLQTLKSLSKNSFKTFD